MLALLLLGASYEVLHGYRADTYPFPLVCDCFAVCPMVPLLPGLVPEARTSGGMASKLRAALPEDIVLRRLRWARGGQINLRGAIRGKQVCAVGILYLPGVGLAALGGLWPCMAPVFCRLLCGSGLVAAAVAVRIFMFPMKDVRGAHTHPHRISFHSRMSYQQHRNSRHDSYGPPPSLVTSLQYS